MIKQRAALLNKGFVLKRTHKAIVQNILTSFDTSNAGTNYALERRDDNSNR